MPAKSRAEEQVRAALAAVEADEATLEEKADMLMEIAMGLQQKPKSPSDIDAAITLYQKALEIVPASAALLTARIEARLGTALLAQPSDDGEPLVAARQVFESALQVLRQEGLPEEIAEAEMNLGLALQNLAAGHRARIQDAIAAYQRSLRTFDHKAHPKEFAILQNNLATAFLSIPFSDERSKMREALAVQSFEEGLAAVTLIDHPAEYAMLQNNLGNALQYVSSSHRIENGFRALDAYDEALKVRTRRDSPGAYANTIANKANCLANLPDDPGEPERGNAANLAAAIALYHEAGEIFLAQGESEKAQVTLEAVADLEAALIPEPRRANGAQ